MTAPVTHRSIAALKLPRSVAVLISVARAILLSMTGNASLPSPTPTLAVVGAALADLEIAEVDAHMRTTGAVAVRNQRLAVLVALLQQLRAYVQSVVDGDPERGPAIIESAAMSVKRVGVRPPRVFAAKPGAVSGSVVLVTRAAARRASYEWELSSDAGKSWQVLPVTLQSETRTSGLQPGSTYSFRYRAVTKMGATEWSQPLSLLVR
jgi:hypothetical protein